MEFDILKQKIERATRKAFTEMFEKHGSENIYSFALYSDGGAMTVCPSTNTLEYLENADPDDLAFYKFEPAEWKYEMRGADEEFNEICQQLCAEVNKNDDDDWFDEFQENLFETCIEVLEKLKNENFFKQITGREIFLHFTVFDLEFEAEEIKTTVNRLNDNHYKTEYLDWMKTWGS